MKKIRPTSIPRKIANFRHHRPTCHTSQRAIQVLLLFLVGMACVSSAQREFLVNTFLSRRAHYTTRQRQSHVSHRFRYRRRQHPHQHSVITPVSYRSQPLHFDDPNEDDPSQNGDQNHHDDTTTTTPWYNDPRNRPWNVNFTPKSPGTYSWTSKLVIANVGMYALQVFFPKITNWGIKLSDRVLRGQELHRLVTPMFLHGGLTHLLTNTYSLQAVGPDVERYFGAGRFLCLYVLSGVAANFVSAVKTPNPSLGASGAVFGVVGGYLVFLNRNMDLFGRRGEYMAGAVSRTIMMNLVLGAFSPMVDNWSHLGGAVAGGTLAYYFGPRLLIGEMPNGARTIVDRPILRLPRSIEAIPERMGNRLEKMKRRMRVETFKPDRPDKPWRGSPKRGNDRRRVPENKSVRPRF